MPHPQPPPGVARGAVALHLPATAPCKFAELSGRRRGRDGWWPWWAGSRRRRPRLSFPLFSWIFPYSCTPPPKTLRYGAPPPLEEGETCRLCSLSGCGQLLLRATTSCRLLLLSTETSQLGAYSPPASPALQPLQPGPLSVTPAGEDHPGPFLQHLRHQEAIFLIANSHSAVHHPQPPDGVALGSVALHIPAGSQFPVDTCIWINYMLNINIDSI